MSIYYSTEYSLKYTQMGVKILALQAIIYHFMCFICLSIRIPAQAILRVLLLGHWLVIHYTSLMTHIHIELKSQVCPLGKDHYSEKHITALLCSW